MLCFQSSIICVILSTALNRNKFNHFFAVFGLLYFPRVWLRSGTFINSKILHFSTKSTPSILFHGYDKEIIEFSRIKKRDILIVLKAEQPGTLLFGVKLNNIKSKPVIFCKTLNASGTIYT